MGGNEVTHSGDNLNILVSSDFMLRVCLEKDSTLFKYLIELLETLKMRLFVSRCFEAIKHYAYVSAKWLRVLAREWLRQERMKGLDTDYEKGAGSHSFIHSHDYHSLGTKYTHTHTYIMLNKNRHGLYLHEVSI